MQKKLTITIDEEVYARLHSVIGRRRISRFIETLVRPHVSNLRRPTKKWLRTNGERQRP